MFDTFARSGIQSLRASTIREVANAGFGRADVLPFWFGESDLPTPTFIAEAAAAALAQGRTRYTHNLGREDLRAELGAYLGRLHGAPVGVERLAVTNSGVSALMIVAQALLAPGDRAVVVTPIWPNIAEIPRVLSAEVASVPLSPVEGRWALDLDRLMDALTLDTRVLFLNSPNNPTGWTLPAADRAAILERCRAYGIWLIADDVYERLSFGAVSAPSFLPMADKDDRLVSTNSFSKAWRMTGWRLGWIAAPAPLIAGLGTLIEYNTSCAPDFVQSAGIVALREGEQEISDFRRGLEASRDLLLEGLKVLPGVEAPTPDGAMYAFFRIAGREDSLGLAKALIAKAGLGLAPGSAFGPEGEGWLRWCFAARPQALEEGLARLQRFLTT